MAATAATDRQPTRSWLTRTAIGQHRGGGAPRPRGARPSRLVQDPLHQDGADSLIIRRTTHARPRDVNAGYERFTWATICREVEKLCVGILDGEVLPLATSFA